MEQLTKDQVRSSLVLPFGFVFEDLYQTDQLQRLDGLFLEDLGQTAPALRDSLLAARENPASLAPKAHSTLILELAPYLEDFVGSFFGIQTELDKLRTRHSELAPIYAVKRRFVQRKAVTGFTEEKASEIDGYALAPELEMLLQEPLSDLSFANQVSRWLENETEYAHQLQLAASYAAWATLSPQGKAKHRSSVLFKVPHKLDPHHLVATEAVDDRRARAAPVRQQALAHS